jgi:hypothetical protein
VPCVIDCVANCQPARAMSRLTRVVAVALLCVIAMGLGGSRAAAQTLDTSRVLVVALGARVRLWERAAADLSLPVVGSVTRITKDSVGIEPDGGASAAAFSRLAVTHIEFSAGPRTGSRGSAAWKAAIIGGLGGGVLGVIVGNLTRRNAARYGLYAAGVGAAGGAAVGASWPGEAWTPAQLPATGVGR